MVDVLPIDTPSLGDRSYLAHDGDVGVVIDPQRDVDRVSDLAAGLGIRVTHVAETHIHNDYVTGGLALAQTAGAHYLVNGADPVRFTRTPVHDGDRVPISEALALRVMATPGHTFTHVAYVLETEGRVAGVFTGGSLLYGSTGRPDLLGPENTPALARAQYRSAHRLATELPDSAPVFPTHGFGSFCAATQTDGLSSTIGREKQVNPALTREERSYVEALLAGWMPGPPTTRTWPRPTRPGHRPHLSPPHRGDPAELRRRIEGWRMGGRPARPGGVRGGFPARLGRLPARRQLRHLPRLGAALGHPGDPARRDPGPGQHGPAGTGPDRHRPPGRRGHRPAVDWAAGQPLDTLRLAKFGDLAAAHQASPPDGGPVVLDVRRQLEWAEEHIAGAAHIPLHELPGRAFAEVPAGEVWVHCQSGYRALAAASLLAAQGRQVISVDDDFGNAQPRPGLPVACGPEPAKGAHR